MKTHKRFLNSLYINSLLILLVTIMFSSNGVTAADTKNNEKLEQAKETLINFYTEIINENYGAAEQLYKVPTIGEHSTVQAYRSMTNSVDYFNYIFPQDEYTITDFSIQSIESFGDSLFEANISLIGNKTSGSKEEIVFSQDIIISTNENIWKISLEDYPLYKYGKVEITNIEDLSDKEIIYRFFSDLENNNYGAAAQLINPMMTGIDKDQKNITTVLKDWHVEQKKHSKHISATQLFILNEIIIDDKRKVYLVSSNPFRDDSEFSSSNECNPCSTPSNLFIEMDKTNGLHLNVSDGAITLTNLLNNNSNLQKEKSDEFIKKFGLLVLGVAGVAAVILCVSWLIYTVHRPVRVVERELIREANSPPPVDISSSVDQLLAKPINDVVKNKVKKTDFSKENLKKSSLSKTRKIHIADSREAESVNNIHETSIKRKVYLDDE